MSQTDNVIPFRKPGTVASESAGESGDIVVPSMRSEVQQSMDSLVEFLSFHDGVMKGFVGGFICGDPTDPESGDEIFHVITSPLDAADYAMALKYLEDSFRRRLMPIDED